MGTTILRRHLGRKALGLCLLLFGLTPTWAATVSINSVTYTGGSFLIASDASNPAAGYTRDTIPVSVSAAFSGIAFDEPVRSYRVRFRILDDLGAEVSLASGTSVSPSVIWPSSFAQFTGQPLPSTVTFTGTPTPSVRLDVNRTYRVEAQVQSVIVSQGIPLGTSVGSPAYSSFRRFYHFTNTTANDAERNVVARMASSASYGQRFAITGSPTQSGFLVNAPYELHRYDNYTAANPADATPVVLVWTVRLFREAGATDVEVPLLADASF